MRRFAVMFRTLLTLFALLCLVAVPLSVPAEEIAPEVKAAIIDMLTTHDKALNEQDLDAVMSTFSDTQPTVLLGTGPGERWLGKEEIADAYTHFFMDFDKGTLSTECDWSPPIVQGNFASLVVMCKFADSLKDVTREYALNISAVLEKTDDKWYFATFHFSNLMK